MQQIHCETWACPALKRRDSEYSEMPKVTSDTVAELEIKVQVSRLPVQRYI